MSGDYCQRFVAHPGMLAGPIRLQGCSSGCFGHIKKYSIK